jgi:hypothetical protein
VMSKPVSRVWPFSVGFWPMVIFLKNRSFISTTRLQEIFSRSMFSRAKRVRSSGSQIIRVLLVDAQLLQAP